MLSLRADVEWALWCCGWCLATTAACYALCDLHYFLRMLVAHAWARLFLARLKPHETAVTYGVCAAGWRYARELDFARLDFCERTGLRAAISRWPGGGVLHAVSVAQHCDPLPLLAPFRLHTALAAWDRRHLYLQHRLLSWDGRRQHAAVLCTLRVLGPDVHDLLGQPSAHPPDVAHLELCVAASRERLRAAHALLT